MTEPMTAKEVVSYLRKRKREWVAVEERDWDNTVTYNMMMYISKEELLVQELPSSVIHEHPHGDYIFFHQNTSMRILSQAELTLMLL